MTWERVLSLMRLNLAPALAAILLSSCNDPKGIPGHDGLVEQVQKNRVGIGSDQWIEMKNNAGEWEKTGLIFGYVDDYEECLKAVAGLKRTNFARDYRCMLAN